MSGDGELIELIDVDPAAFGQPQRSSEQNPDRPPLQVPWKPLLLGTAAVLVVAGIVAGLLAWRPWEPDPRLVFTDLHPSTSELSERLVFDDPPAALRTVSIASTPPSGSTTKFTEWNDGSLGYFFGQPDATFTPDDGTDRWFGFYAVPSTDASAPTIFGTHKIANAPAEVSDETGGALIRLAWGPVDGQTFIGAASHMSTVDAIAIADQIRIVNGRPVLLDRAALKGLRPLGSFGAYTSLVTLAENAQDNGQDLETMVGLYYGSKGQSVVSLPGPQDAVDMVPFLLSKSAREGTVHGHRAYGFTKGSGPFGWTDRSSVIWWEGGRLIAVNGDGDLKATFALAETVRPATAAEWAAAQAVAQAD